ncbi:hypothetical protein [Methylovorus glucosotrophus]|uniref:Uncharacterized protein n=1 Tax=Methylovorus glucosotrophus (strain SIP3-4) TaxID=582744 RepID=C6X8Z3_METGS|nr:hypothetical protein [Methylovorus glucosotrophus]ACT49613.1 hypothetical protein Msip34_0365 [Methylovorus glucosotrophus SIP3-4]
MEREISLKKKDHKAMDAFLERVLDAYKKEEISKSSALGGLAHVMAALDIRNTGEALAWFNQDGVEFFIEGDKLLGKG